MPSTPLSSATSYCTIAQFLQLNDARRVGELLLDTGARAEAEAILAGSSGLPESSVTNQVLNASSGEIEAACMVGGRYKPADLQAMTGVSANFLASLVSDLAMGRLLRRRKAEAMMTASEKEARRHLTALQDGKEIFGLQEQQDAGLPPDPETISVDFDSHNLATRQAQRLFGWRSRGGPGR